MLFFISLLTFILVIGFLWFIVPFALRKIETHRLTKLCAQKRAIVLTYDDGPSQALTTPLANLLKSRGAIATFFIIGREALLSPDGVTRLKTDGHEIGSHTLNHLNAWKTHPLASVNDIRSGNEALTTLGAPTQLFRPPFGKTTFATLLYGLSKRLRFAYWTVDSRDSWNRKPIEEVVSEIKAQGGGVVLMHDFDLPKRGPSPENHADYVLNLTSAILDLAEQSSYSILHFNALFEKEISA